MVKIISLSYVMICMLVVGTLTPTYKVEGAWIEREMEIDSRLKQELYGVLQSIEETLNYSSQIEILDLEYKGSVLYIDLSNELILYGGGTAAEYYVGKTLFDWGFEATDAEFISLLIEGQADTFPEGSRYNLYSREDYIQNMKNTIDEGQPNEKNNICNSESRESKRN